MSQDIREQLKAHFLDYANNYLSIETWGLDKNINKEDATQIIDMGRRLHDEDAEALKAVS
jgi:hypothetical protein